MLKKLIFATLLLNEVFADTPNIVPGTTGCTPEFHHRCHCGFWEYEDKTRYVTVCHNTNFDRNHSLRMLANLPIETEVLIFSGNDLQTIPSNVFGTENVYEKLKEIDFSDNNIHDIQAQAFHRVPNVKKLKLNNNSWKVKTHVRLFANMPELMELELNNAFDKSEGSTTGIKKIMGFLKEFPLNNLETLSLSENWIGPQLHSEWFCSAPTLKRIVLSNNLISNLNWNVTCPLNLREIDLRNNKLPYLNNGSMRTFDILQPIVRLENNPFECSCNIVDFHRWLGSTWVNVTNKEIFQCACGYPESNFKRNVMHLSETDLLCNENYVHFILLNVNNVRFGLMHVIFVIVGLVLCAFVFALIFMNRNRVIKVFKKTVNQRSKMGMMRYSIVKNEREI